MNENQTVYRMNRLLRITEIEAFSARTNVGSRTRYFGLLTEFIDTAPFLLDRLIASLQANNAELLQKTSFELQKLLLSIGAINLLWDAEKAAEQARANSWRKCADGIVLLISRVKKLREQLQETRVDSAEKLKADDGGAHSTHIVAIEQGTVASGRPRAPIEPERFERLRQFENRSPREIMALIRDLMAFSYNYYIDALLASVHECLSNNDVESAERQLDNLLQSVRDQDDSRDKGIKKKILALDDAPDILQAVNTILRDEYMVYCATNHMAALKVLANNNPDLVILDIEMPDMSGFEMIAVIRGIKTYKNIPALFLSGNVTVENIVNSRKAGVNDFIKKPIEPSFLLSKVRQHIEKTEIRA